MPPVPIILRWPRRAVRSKLCGIAHLALKLPPSRERANDPTRRRSADVAGDGAALVVLALARQQNRRCRARSPHIHPPDSLVAATGPAAGQGRARARAGQGRAPRAEEHAGPCPSLARAARPGQTRALPVFAWPSACLACGALRTEQADKRASISDGGGPTDRGLFGRRWEAPFFLSPVAASGRRAGESASQPASRARPSLPVNQPAAGGGMEALSMGESVWPRRRLASRLCPSCTGGPHRRNGRHMYDRYLHTGAAAVGMRPSLPIHTAPWQGPVGWTGLPGRAGSWGVKIAPSLASTLNGGCQRSNVRWPKQRPRGDGNSASGQRGHRCPNGQLPVAARTGGDSIPDSAHFRCRSVSRPRYP